MSKVRIIEVASELGAGTRGASLGVDAIKIAALDYGSSLFRKRQSVVIPARNELLFDPPGSPYAKRISGIVEVCEQTAGEVNSCLRKKIFPLVLSGDHSTSAGTIAGIRKAFPGRRLGVIWIDAHADLHSPYTTPSGNMHGMPVAASLGEDNLQHRHNKPDRQTVEWWKRYKNLGKAGPKFGYGDIVYISLRDVEPEEMYLLKKNKVKSFTTAEVRRLGVEKTARSALAYLGHCDHIYVSFDVDSMDASISKGTGTPVRNGITEKEAGGLCVRLVQNEKVACFEITEVNPTLDKENLMAENAFEILQRVLAQVG